MSHYIRIYGNVNHPWPRPRRFTAINSDVVDNNYNLYSTATFLPCEFHNYRFFLYFPIQSPAKPMSSALAQQVKEMQKRVAQLEQERLAALSRTDVEKELQIQVLGTSWLCQYVGTIILIGWK